MGNTRKEKSMKRWRTFRGWVLKLPYFCLLTYSLLTYSLLFAEVPQTLHYQGHVRESNGGALIGEHVIIMRLYDAATGGSALWEERHDVTFAREDKGVFSILLGSVTPFAGKVSFNQPLWLSIELDGGGEFSPRQPLSAASYAINAATLNGLSAEELIASTAGGDITGVVAGAGLTGGGESGAATLSVGAGTGVVVSEDAVSVDVGTTAGKIVQLDSAGALPAVSGANLTALPAVSGISLTDLNASNLTSGTVPDARLSSNVSLLGPAIESTDVADGTLTAADTAATFLTAGSGMTVAKGASSWRIDATGTGGDITGVTAGTGLSGGGASGEVAVSLSTPVAVANGGTGGTDAATARANVGAAAAGANSDITSLSGLTTALTVGQGGTGAATTAAARTNLGLGSLATQNANTVSVTGGSITGIVDLAVADGGTGASTAATARTSLGAAAAGANSDITSLSGLTTPLSIAQGGTGASTAGVARANLINCLPIGGVDSGSRNADFQIATFGDGGTSNRQDRRWPVPVSGTVSALRAFVGAAPGSGANAWTVTLRQNGANTALSCTISGTSVSCSGAGSVSVSAGDRLGVEFIEAGSAAATTGAGWSACFVP